MIDAAQDIPKDLLGSDASHNSLTEASCCGMPSWPGQALTSSSLTTVVFGSRCKGDSRVDATACDAIVCRPGDPDGVCGQVDILIA